MIKIRKKEYRKHITSKSYVIEFTRIKNDLGLEPEEFVAKLNNREEVILNYLTKIEKKRSIPINSMVANGAPDSSEYIIEFKEKDIS
jgi:hypothetical protein|tara:strand:+ start:482 stop:742 length:261 start_codon:yes stop_codon:yes gene_type:complete